MSKTSSDQILFRPSLTFQGARIIVGWSWYTPPDYVEAARHCMGAIDLDPASCDIAQNHIIKAKKYYTQQTNGLDKEWHGRVLLCPPYYQPEHNQFIAKAIEEEGASRVSEIIIITHTLETYNDWFHDLIEWTTAICFVRGFIEWVPEWRLVIPEEQWDNCLVKDKHGNMTNIRNMPKYDKRGSVIFYKGQYPENFQKYFERFGTIKCMD